jgi:hypothetical protein
VVVLPGLILFSLAFTGLIWLLGARLDGIERLPDQGASWYFWKLAEPTFWSRATSWGFYLMHQLSLWGMIYYAQTRIRRYSDGLRPFNLMALGVNAFFVLLHLLQTHLWYDGLAQDVSIWSSQGSVIVLLIWVLLMENDRRGLFFGARVPLSKQVMRAAKKYHGYFFSWAVVYTFWYHPAEALSGHMFGFFYTTLLILQGGLMFTRAHTNRYWTLFLEVVVLAHGTMVAVTQGAGLWPMFFFGFGGVFVITQMHGLGWSRWLRLTVLLAYLGGALFVYAGNLGQIFMILSIPFIDYLGVFLLAGLFWLGLTVAKRLSGPPAPPRRIAPREG